jgi:hypothetical protein
MSIDKLDPDGLRFGGLIRFAVALCVAAGLVYALVQLGLWHGVVKLN